MEPEQKKDLVISSSPQIHSPQTTASIMWSVVVCLLPAGIWGVYVFGVSSVWILAISIGAAVLTELLISALSGKVTVMDGSAFLTGLLIGYNMPPSIPFYIPIIASVFAIAVVKWAFGGLGTNWMNPALAGRVFVFFSWSGPMNTWKAPSTLFPGLETDSTGIAHVFSSATPVDTVTQATPLGFIKTKLLGLDSALGNPLEYLKLGDFKAALAEKVYGASEATFPTQMDQNTTGFLNDAVFSRFGVSLPEGYMDLFIGNVSGCIGEVSALLLLIGAIYLFVRKIITWEIPVSFIAAFAVCTWIFSGVPLGTGFFSGDILFNLFTGGLILGAFYMATDMSTSPLNRNGMLIFGAGAGFLTFLIRTYGSPPEGVSLAIILMNVFVPLINRLTKYPRYGLIKDNTDD